MKRESLHINTVQGIVTPQVLQTGNTIRMAVDPNPDSAVPMVPAQRAKLHELVGDLLAAWDSLGDAGEAKRAWRIVHEAADVETIDQLTGDGYRLGVAALQRELGNAEEAKRTRKLLSMLLTVTEGDPTQRDRAKLYAAREFGISFFKDLSFTQIKQVLTFLETPTCTHDCTSCRADTAAQHRNELNRAKAEAKLKADDLSTQAMAVIAQAKAQTEMYRERVGKLRQELIDLRTELAARTATARQRWITVTAMAAFVGILFGAWAF
ncbi:hypothetical protein GCM10007860_06330 [Chitiniphilus shinanonensis]|uniref:Transmembrane protein n=2 Tax=Chitiniphilus shinanonensis TaxID=553088 RepID=A0ABQ6BUK3_9NEIS|nr:hypothetical protein GCM10007860_06330 [Chitiniphilus shinanonensis]